MKKRIMLICLLVSAFVLSASITTAQGSLARSEPVVVSKPSLKFTGYTEASGELKMAVRLRIREGCSQMTVRLSHWNGLQINGDTLWQEGLSGRKELSFVSRLTLPKNDTSGIVLTVSDSKEVMEAGLGRFGVMILNRFLVNTSDTLEVHIHPPWEKPLLLRKTDFEISKQGPFELGLMRKPPQEKTGKVTLLVAGWLGYDPRMGMIPGQTDDFRWEEIHMKLEPRHGVTVHGDTAWTERQPNTGRQFLPIELSLAADDTCYAVFSMRCRESLARVDLKFVSTGDSTKCWWAGPGENFRPIPGWHR